MSVPPKVTPFAYDVNYPAGADPWSGTATKKVTATRNSGFKPKTKIPAQVVNYELNVAQTANEALRTSLVESAITGASYIPASLISGSATASVIRALWQPSGSILHLIHTATGEIQVVRSGSNIRGGYGVFGPGSSGFYPADMAMQTSTVGTTVTEVAYFAGSYGAVLEQPSNNTIRAAHVLYQVAPYLHTWDEGAASTPDFFHFERITTGGGPTIGSYEAFVSTSFTSVTLPVGMSGSAYSQVHMARNEVGGELWLASGDTVAIFEAPSTFTLSEVGLGVGYECRGITWNGEYFFLATKEGTDTRIYRRAVGAPSWTLVSIIPIGSPSLFIGAGPNDYDFHDLASFGGILLAVHGSNASFSYCISASRDGITWSRVAEIDGTSVFNVNLRPRFSIRSNDGAVICSYASTIGAGTGVPVWVCGAVGLGAAAIIGA